MDNSLVRSIYSAGLKQHSECVIAYLQGKTIEFETWTGAWSQIKSPSFLPNNKYRIKLEGNKSDG